LPRDAAGNPEREPEQWLDLFDPLRVLFFKKGNMNRNNVMTASRMNALSACQRRHFWAYEAQLKPAAAADALMFGTAWHKAMEEMAKGADAAKAFISAAECGLKDEFVAATLQAMLQGYAERYGENPVGLNLLPEVKFSLKLSKGWKAEGKIDGIIGNTERENAVRLREYKTAGQDIDASSDYWLRLRDNTQINTYSEALLRLGKTVDQVSYDVARKPTIRPLASVPVLGSDGLKQVIDQDGMRVCKKDGTTKQTADKEKGETLLVAPETAEQYGARLLADIRSRPDFYFQRREYQISVKSVDETLAARREAVRLVKHLRSREKFCGHPNGAWLKCNCSMTCKFCPYETLCLQGINPVRGVDEAPAGYRWSDMANEELAEEVQPAE